MLDITLGKIEYSDDEEYRASITRIFENGSFEPIFDDIYTRTKDDPFFQRIYLTAAGFMLSEDPCLGVCVLFAYDYAAAFYAVLCDYLNGCSATEESKTNKATLEKLLERNRN